MNLFGKRQSACIFETLMAIFVLCMFCLGCEDNSSARSGATSQESYLAKAQPDGGAEAEEAAKGEKTADAKKVEMGRNVWLLVESDKRQVMVQAEVCLREGMLEHLMCRQRTKEHEAVLSADVDARDIHKALIVAKATPGKTVQFKDDGTVLPPTGTAIKVTLTYKDKDKNKTVTVPGRDWIRDFKTKKSLDVDWVFAGSQFLENPLEKDKPPLYAANGGDVICVSNFEGAMLDLPINSSKNNAELEFEAFTERIPPIGTAITVLLEPVLEAKQDKPKDPFKERQDTQKEKAKDKFINPFPNLKFEHPLLMARPPGSNRLFVGEQAGILYSFVNRPDAKAELFFDLRKEIKTLRQLPGAKEVEAVYGLAFHPDFQKNHQCFVCYTIRGDNPEHLADGTRVSRFTVTKTDPPRIQPASEEVILSFLQGGHNGGDIHFGPDGMLYISTGDAASPNPPDPLDTGQDISDLLSSILRIDVDRRDPGRNYAVPKDNPFVGRKGARPEVWAYGFRNPWRISFDTQTGELFVGDVGWELWESVHRVEKGGNYGWSAMEGPQPIKPHKVGPTPIRPALIELPHTIACSVTGGRVYHGKRFPELQGAYIFGDWETRRLWASRFEGDRTKEMPEITRPSVRIVAFGEDKDGELYFLDYDGGRAHTLARNDGALANNAFPTKLSETGLFASVKDHTPASGVVPFKVNGRQWLDGATAEHWAAFPGTSASTLHTEGRPIPGMVYWHSFRMHFPNDAVLLRTLSLAGRRVETQLLHYDGVDWRGYTFAWRDDQADADLVPAEGAEKEVRDADAKGTRLWQFLSRTQCLLCHNNQSEYALAFLPEQLNRPGADGCNQLVSLSEEGYIHRVGKDDKALPPFDAASRPASPRSLTRRMRLSPWRRGRGVICTPTAATAISMVAAAPSRFACNPPCPRPT